MSKEIIDSLRAISTKYDKLDGGNDTSTASQLETVIGKCLYVNDLLPLSERDIEVMLSTISMMCVIDIQPSDMVFVNTLVAYLINYYDVLKEADGLRDDNLI